MLTEGLKSKKTVTVGAENTAAKVGSGTLPVFATPAMATLCEATAAESVEELLGRHPAAAFACCCNACRHAGNMRERADKDRRETVGFYAHRL